MTRKAIWAGGLFCLVLGLSAQPAKAQFGQMQGSVKGEDGKPLAGAIISIDREDGRKGHYEIKTDGNGKFFHAGLPLGRFSVSVMREGKKFFSIGGVQTQLSEPAKVDIDLQQERMRAEPQASGVPVPKDQPVVLAQTAPLGRVYVSSQNGGDRLQLNGDNTFSLQEGGQSFSGSYSVAGTTLKLHIVELGKDADIAINGDSLIVNGAESWVQPAPAPPVAAPSPSLSSSAADTSGPSRVPYRNRETANSHDLAQLTSSLERGENVVFAVRKGLDEVHREEIGSHEVVVSKTEVAFREKSGAKIFAVTPDKLLTFGKDCIDGFTKAPCPATPRNENNAADEPKTYHIRVNVAVINSKGKEEKQRFDFYHPAAGRDNGTHCNGCDASMDILYALLQRIKDNR